MADIKKELNDIKNAVYGREVRGSIHDGIYKVNRESEGSRQIANNTKQRQDAVEQQFNTLLSEWSDDKPIDNAETIAARTNTKESKTYENLGKRLDEEYEKVTAQLAETDQARRYESMINRKEPDGLYITWTDDDGWVEVYERMKPLMLDYNIPMTSAIIPDRVLNSTSGVYLTPEQVKELSELGMEFLSHTNSWDSSDRPIDWPEERLDEDFRLSQQQVKQLGGNPRGLVLPYADNSDLIQKVARRYYDFVVGTGSIGNPLAGKVLYPGEIDNYYITRVSVEQDFNYVKQRLDEGAEKGIAWVNLVSHIYLDWYSEEYCRQIIEYALSLGYKFITNQEGVERFGNIAQFGDTKIGSDGSINSDSLGKVKHFGYREVDANTPITFFPKNTISITKIRAMDADTFPLQESGILETHRLDEDVYGYQRYVSTRNKHIHMRFWNTDTNDWSDWQHTELYRFLGLNALKPDDSPILPHLLRQISYTIINREGNDGFPGNKSGTLINYALTYDDFAFQEYYIYHESKVYKRFWDNGSWSRWRKVQDIVGAQYVLPNRLLTSTPASEFEQGITVTYITLAANDSGLPAGATSGNFITIKEDNGVGRTFQEFRQYNSFNKFIRIEKSDGTWSEWRRFVTEPV